MSLARAWTERDPNLTLWVPDLPGHGRSPPLSDDADLDTMARSVIEFIEDKVGGAPVRIVGHSLGGRVAITAATRHAAIEHVTLLDIAPGPVPAGAGPGQVVATLRALPDTAESRADMINHMIRAGISQALATWLAMNLEPNGEAYRWRIDRESLAAFHQRTTTVDLWPLVERPNSPVKHCIRGGESDFVSDADAKRLEAAGCRLSTLGGAGHFLHVEALDGLVDLLAQT
jgi:pimeloyl-ACP methyl ester carboxylesterase